MELPAFVDRVHAHLPSPLPSGFALVSWPHGGRPTDEALGLLPIAGLDPQKAIDAVMDVDHYVGHLDHVAACRSIPDPRFVPPARVRFYQRIDLPLLGAVQHELVLERLPERGGWLGAGWSILPAETGALPAREGFRSDYSHGVWLARPGVLVYAFGSAPRREDVGFLKWKALTTGADAAAATVLKGNLVALGRWAASR